MQATGLVPGCRATLCRRRPQEYIRVAMFLFRFTLNVNVEVMASVSSDAAGEWQSLWSAMNQKLKEEGINRRFFDESLSNTWSNIIVLHYLHDQPG